MTLEERIKKRIEDLKKERLKLLKTVEGKSPYELMDVDMTELFGKARDLAIRESELRDILEGRS